MAITQTGLPVPSFKKGPLAIVGTNIVDQETDLVTAADVLVGEDGKIAKIGVIDKIPDGCTVIDAKNYLITPAFADCHQHLDKTGSLPFTPNPSGTLMGAIEAFGLFARQTTRQDTEARAKATIAQCLRRGTTAIRSHVNVDQDTGLNGLEVLADIREELKDVFNLQLVAFLSSGAVQDMDWLQQYALKAAKLGDAVGGTPALASDPKSYLDCLFETAAQSDLPLDLHLDEHLNADAQLFDEVLDRVERFNMQGRVAFGHCSVLSALEVSEFRRICDRILECDIPVVTLPTANLYLQGRDADKLPPRGLTRVKELVDAGVNVAAASDNINDPFVPIGSGDMSELARWTLVAAQLFSDDISDAFEMVTSNAAKFMGLRDFGKIEVGNIADLVISDVSSISELITIGPERRHIVSKGHLVVSPSK